MRWGTINLFCPVCNQHFKYSGNCVSGIMHHSKFGYVCGKSCFKEAELKYVRMILGKDDPEVELSRPTELEKLLDLARQHVMTAEELDAQARSFAYGNVHLHNPDITRKDIDAAADKLKEKP